MRFKIRISLAGPAFFLVIPHLFDNAITINNVLSRNKAFFSAGVSLLMLVDAC